MAELSLIEALSAFSDLHIAARNLLELAAETSVDSNELDDLHHCFNSLQDEVDDMSEKLSEVEYTRLLALYERGVVLCERLTTITSPPVPGE